MDVLTVGRSGIRVVNREGVITVSNGRSTITLHPQKQVRVDEGNMTVTEAHREGAHG